jgi:fructose-specific phosphotransferase system IIA component
MYTVSNLLKERNIFTNLTVRDKKELLDLLISSFKDDVSAEELQAIKKAVFQREKLMTTGIGKGLAIPHGKSSEITENRAAFAVLKRPVNYGAFDGKPVSIVFLFAGPDAEKRSHVKILRQISRLMNDKAFFSKAGEQATAAELLILLREQEQAISRV